MAVSVRDERPGDHAAIRDLVTAAFAGKPYSDGTEAAIVDGLRAADALTISLFAESAGEVVGHVAFSPVTVDGVHDGWFGLGPLAVRPDWQRRGVGQALVVAGLARLRQLGAQGCVLLGDPAYYGRFGFVGDPRLRYRDVDPAYFQRIAFGPHLPAGAVEFHPAFDAG